MPEASPARSPLFDVEVTGPGRGQRMRFDRAEITVGRVATDLILPAAGIARRHARIFVREGRLFVEEVAGASGTLVNGARIESAAPIAACDLVEIGPYRLRVELVLPLVRDPDEGDPIEAGLLAAIARGDDEARLIYADWLEERGDAARAELLRVQQDVAALPAGDPAQGPAAGRLRELAATTDAAWRRLVARPPIEGCPLDFAFQCPKEWAALDATDAASVRFCRSCHRHVFYCTDLGAARAHGARGHCVAIDPAAYPPPRAPEPPVPPAPETSPEPTPHARVRMGQLLIVPSFWWTGHK